MPAPENRFKTRLQAQGDVLWGLWVALASPQVAELCAGAGFDWVLIDAEHGPNDIPLIAQQLAACAGQASHPVVRLPMGEAWIIKQALDVGAQSLMIPQVETAAQAQALVRACRYPPQGIRGMGAGLGRATNYGRVDGYVATANAQICLIAQIESRLAMDNLEAIAAVEGVDALLIGPADLAADLGHPGRADAPEVAAAVTQILRRGRAVGCPMGIMTTDPAMIARARAEGARFMATETDVGLLTGAAARHLAALRGAQDGAAPFGGY